MTILLPLERHFARPGEPLSRAFTERNLFPWIQRRPRPLEDGPAIVRRLLAERRVGKRVAYLHIPFCANHCLFCGFYRNRSAEDSMAEYARHLELDIAMEGAEPSGQPIQAVYFGGGTPSALSAGDLHRLVSAVRRHLPLTPDCEITVEGRVAGFDDDKIDACLDAGANRFSIGIQTFDTALRQRMGRRAERSEAIAFMERLRDRDRAVVVCDLIFGLPGQSMEMWRGDVTTCLSLGLDGVDLYCLTLHDSSPLALSIAKGALPPVARLENMAAMYDAGLEMLDDAGWRHLNQAHWASATRERNLYNQLVKAGADCLAFGAGAGGLVAGHRYVIQPDVELYAKAIGSGTKPVTVVLPPPANRPARDLVMGSLEGGRLDITRLEALTAPGLAAALEPLLAQWEAAGLLRRRGDALILTPAGWFWHCNLVGSLFELIDLFMDGGASSAAPLSPNHKEYVMSATHTDPSILDNLRAQLDESQDGVLETIAIEHGVTPLQVSECLPDHCRVAITGEAFEAVMADLTTWGEVTFLVHTCDLILECKGTIPPGKVARGFFNLDGHGAIGGHLRYGNCAAIHFVKRPFMKMDTCAITFFNDRGDSMFKVYVGRDEKRQMLPDQIRRFDALRDRLAAARPQALAG